MRCKGNHFAAGIDWMKSFWLAAEMPKNEISLRKLMRVSEVSGYDLNIASP